MQQDVYGKVMLAELRVSQWTGRKSDKQASSEVAKNHQVDAKMGGVYYKSLVSGDALDSIKTLVNEARAYHWRLTLPWADSGARVLSSALYFDYMAAMQDYGERFRAAVDLLMQEYPLYRQEAQRTLGTLFKESDYPTMEDLADRFAFRVHVTPMPVGADFRCDIGVEETERIRKDIEARTSEALKSATTDAYQRVYDVVNAFVDRLAQEKTVFRDTLVENARELAAILPGLNFTNDPVLARLTTEITSKLCVYHPQTLRTDAEVRRQTYEQALDIKKDMAAWFVGAA